jgi:hypothetical protein
MIPTVEERSIRPCWTDTDVCVCFHDDDTDCHLENTKDPNLRQTDPKKYPCKYNLYTAEYQKLIDSGAV